MRTSAAAEMAEFPSAGYRIGPGVGRGEGRVDAVGHSEGGVQCRLSTCRLPTQKGVSGLLEHVVALGHSPLLR